MTMQEVDQIEVTVLIDNYTDLLRMDNNQIVTRPSIPYGDVLLAEHGLSLHITVWADEKFSSILMDAGASDISLRHNATRLGVDICDTSALVISHGHDDHVGSIPGILKEVARPVLVYIHPGAFSMRQKRVTNGKVIEMASPDKIALMKAGAVFHWTCGPTKLWEERIMVTGEIERSTRFERTNPIYYIEQSGYFVPDIFHDDQAIILNLKRKGLVVITGCAHAGVINTLHYARKITGVNKVHAVIGGFHLSGPFFSKIITPTIAAMKDIDPVWLIPMHCTGWEAVTRFKEEMPEQVILNTVGTTYRFGE